MGLGDGDLGAIVQVLDNRIGSTGALANRQCVTDLDLTGQRALLGFGGGSLGNSGFGGCGLCLIQHNISHADPAIADLTPGHGTNLLLLGNGYLSAVRQILDNTVAGAGALADSQPAIGLDGTGNLGNCRSGGFGNGSLRNRGFGDGSFGNSGLRNGSFLFFLQFLYCFCVIGKFQCDPLLACLAPFIAGTAGGFGDDHDIALIGSANNTVVGAGALAQVHIGCGDLHAHTLYRIGLNLTLAVITIPTGVKGCAGQILRQHSYLAAAGLLGVPTGESMSTVRGGVCRCNALIGIVALNPVRDGATVGIVIDIAIITGLIHGIIAVKVHIGFAKTAANQAGLNLTACVAPQSKCPNQFAAGSTVSDCSMEIAVGIREPAGAQIVCKGHQCIKLMLSQAQVVFIQKLLIDLIFKGSQIVAQQGLCFLFGNTVFQIFLQHIIRAAGAVTHSILAIVPIRFCGKALFLLNYLYKGIADGQRRSRVGSGCTGQNKTCKQHNCQQKTGNTFHHRYTPFKQ